jgi:hypothetical protein
VTSLGVGVERACCFSGGVGGTTSDGSRMVITRDAVGSSKQSESSSCQRPEMASHGMKSGGCPGQNLGMCARKRPFSEAPISIDLRYLIDCFPTNCAERKRRGCSGQDEVEYRAASAVQPLKTPSR